MYNLQLLKEKYAYRLLCRRSEISFSICKKKEQDKNDMIDRIRIR